MKERWRKAPTIQILFLQETSIVFNRFFSCFIFVFNVQSQHNTYRLDRKSSRGMIYENEELRLRTININAEVERGKTTTHKMINSILYFIFFLQFFYNLL